MHVKNVGNDQMGWPFTSILESREAGADLLTQNGFSFTGAPDCWRKHVGESIIYAQIKPMDDGTVTLMLFVQPDRPFSQRRNLV
jgi:hypothetical protein